MAPIRPPVTDGADNGHQTDQQGDAAAVDDAAENVAAVVVGAQRVGEAGIHEPLAQVLIVDAIGGDDVGEDGAEDEDDDDAHAHHGQLVRL